MEKNQTNISEQLARIKKLSVKLLSTVLKIMKIVAEDENDLTDEIVTVLDLEKDKEVIVTQWLRDYCDTLVLDAERVKNEVDKFGSAYELGEEQLEAKTNEYPFLAEVWYGDAYGKRGVKGLSKLEAELEKDIHDATESKIVDAACKHSF